MKVLVDSIPEDFPIKVGEGREATIFRHATDPGRALKAYKQVTPELADRSKWMAANPPAQLRNALGELRFAWPIKLAYEPTNNSFIGPVIPFMINNAALKLVKNPTGRIPQITERFLGRAAASLAEIVAALHAARHCAPDLSDLNTLINRHGDAVLIDMLSAQLNAGTRTFPAACITPDYCGPELLGVDHTRIVRTPQMDVWSLACLVDELLRGCHPFDCQYTGPGRRPSRQERVRLGLWPYSGRHPQVQAPRGVPSFATLPRDLQELFRQTFDIGHSRPDARPSAAEFAQVLSQLDPGGMFACAVAEAHWLPFIGVSAPAATPAAGTAPVVIPALRRLAWKKVATWGIPVAASALIGAAGLYLLEHGREDLTNRPASGHSLRTDYSRGFDKLADDELTRRRTSMPRSEHSYRPKPKLWQMLEDQ